ncbi:MAG: Cft2 family RNA processing exonuclease [Planctomycetaceae bacterium]|jgi:Cft2 family RNA processing exonuclease
MEVRNQPNPDTFKDVNNKTFDDSVIPILDLAEMIESDHELLADLLHIEMAPGHTPGSIAIGLTDQGESAIFTGDICHHPIQVYEPD